MRFTPWLLALMLLITTLAPPAHALNPDNNTVFSSTASEVSGEFASFSLNDDLAGLPLYLSGPNMSRGNLLTAFSIEGSPIFSAISFSAMGNTTLEQVGRSFVLDGDGGRLEIHDTPSGTIIFNSDSGGELSITAADGVSARIENNTVIIGRDGTLGWLFTDSGSINITGQTILISLDSGSKAVFRALPHLRYDANEAEIASFILSGKIAGELYITREGDLVKDDYSRYGTATAQTSMVGKDRTGVAVNEGSGGKIVLIHIPENIMEEVGSVTVDGKDPAAAPSLTQMLAYSGAPDAYYIYKGSNDTTVMVYLSEVGEHTVSIKESGGFSPTAGDYLTVTIGASFVVLAALLLYRKT